MSAPILQIGARVFYPPHGVASVVAVEERELEPGSDSQSFYVLALTRGRVLLPVDNGAPDGLRELVSASKARELLERVKTRPSSKPAPSPRARAAAYADLLRDGSPDGYTEVLRALLFRSRDGKLSANDRRVLEVARGYFVSEVSAALDKPDAEIEALLP